MFLISVDRVLELQSILPLFEFVLATNVDY